jgi:hypothetical protein
MSPSDGLFPPTFAGRRVRPAYKSVGLSLLLVIGFAYTSYAYLGEGSLYVSFPTTLAAVLISTYVRGRSIKGGLPPPYGKGRVTEIGAREVLTGGLLIFASGILLIVVPFVLFFVLPGGLVIGLILGVGEGLALSQPVFFTWVSLLERRTGSLIYSVDELTQDGGKQVMTKRIELVSSDNAA